MSFDKSLNPLCISFDLDTSSTMDISDLNEILAPDWTDIEVAPFAETETIRMSQSATPVIHRDSLEEDDHDHGKLALALTLTPPPPIILDPILISNQPTSCNDKPNLGNLTTELNLLDSNSESILFTCPLCPGKRFRYQSKFNDHMIVHSKLKPFACPTCNKSFSFKHHLQDHQRTHNSTKPFKCSICLKNFTENKYFQLHLISHSISNSDPNQNHNSISNIDDNQNHNQLDNHNPLTFFKCTVCSKSFSQNSLLQIHMLRHGETRIKTTPRSRVRTKTTTNVNANSTEKQSQIDLVKPNRKLNTKIEQNQNYPKKSFHCSYCTKNFNVKSALDQHLTSHSTDKSYQCDLCPKSFKLKGQLNKHALTHFKIKIRNNKDAESEDFEDSTSTNRSDDNPTFYSNSITINTKSNNNSNNNNSPLKCTVCSKQFRKKSDLKKHRLCHNGQSPFKCNICDKMFGDKQSLDRHCQTHSGVKPFKCEICWKTFSLQGNLKEHLIIHSGIKQFTCLICDKSFTRKGDLKKHNQSHEVDKPHLCELCGRGFSRNYNLKLHYKSSHGYKKEKRQQVDFNADVTVNSFQA